jgi:chromosome segregation ATPase
VTQILQEKEQAIENLVQQFKHLQEKKFEVQNELKPLRTRVNEMKAEAENEEDERKVIAVS